MVNNLATVVRLWAKAVGNPGVVTVEEDPMDAERLPRDKSLEEMNAQVLREGVGTRSRREGET
jgi:hypothetical protein